MVATHMHVNLFTRDALARLAQDGGFEIADLGTDDGVDLPLADWMAERAEKLAGPAAPGAVLGPVVSPLEAACGQLVACGEGAVVLLELEADDGAVLRGPTLSEQPWTGKRWSNADEATD